MYIKKKKIIIPHLCHNIHQFCEAEQLSLPTLMITLKGQKLGPYFLYFSSEMNFRQFLMEFPPSLRRIIHNLEKSIIKMNLHKMSVVIKSICLKKYPLLCNIFLFYPRYKAKTLL